MSGNEIWGALAGGPQPAGTPENKARGGWSRMRMAVVAAVAGAVVVGGGVAVANASTSSSSTSSTSSTQQGPGAGGRMGGGDVLQGALHGDFTVASSSGTYATERMQSGTVTAVSGTSITAKSADGHSTTFTVNSSTTVDNGDDAIADVNSGDTVTVVGTVSGDTATAAMITDTTLGGGAAGMPGGGTMPSTQPTS